MSSYSPYFRATTAKQEALRRWSPTQRHKALITAIRNIDPVLAKPQPMPRFIDTPHYWRGQVAAFEAGICHMCNGTGEVKSMGILGDYEPPDPCWICQPATPAEQIPLDEIPF